MFALARNRSDSNRKRRLARLRLACALGCVVVPLGKAVASDVLTSAPIDYSIYRDGEVKRVEKQFASWQLTCDEIKRLSRKFCSLRGVARAADGTIVAALIVSTDDHGRPAAILRLPFGTALSIGVTVRHADPLQKRKPTSLALRPSLCDQAGCEVVWPLAVDDIRTLSSNEPVSLAFRMTRSPPVLAPLLTASVPIEGTIQTAGFAAALQASMAQ